MFGFVKNLTKKKDNGFYLELKEEAPKPAAKPEPAATNGAKPAPAEAQPVASETAAKPSSKEVAAAAKAAKIEAAKAARAAEEKKQAEAAKPVVAAKPQAPAIKTFADKYLMPNGSNGRRRPGANMSAYMDMARQAKTPNINK